jgi:hypothetical protein
LDCDFCLTKAASADVIPTSLDGKTTVFNTGNREVTSMSKSLRWIVSLAVAALISTGTASAAPANHKAKTPPVAAKKTTHHKTVKHTAKKTTKKAPVKKTSHKSTKAKTNKAKS